jgi:hypothetical protein
LLTIVDAKTVKKRGSICDMTPNCDANKEPQKYVRWYRHGAMRFGRA